MREKGRGEEGEAWEKEGGTRFTHVGRKGEKRYHPGMAAKEGKGKAVVALFPEKRSNKHPLHIREKKKNRNKVLRVAQREASMTSPP